MLWVGASIFSGGTSCFGDGEPGKTCSRLVRSVPPGALDNPLVEMVCYILRVARRTKDVGA